MCQDIDDFEEYALKNYPKLFQDILPVNEKDRWGCCIDNGWVGLLKKTCELLKDFPIVFSSVKQKYAALTIYWDFLEEATENEKMNLREKINQIILDAEEQSTHTCELCGKDGKIVKHDGYYEIVCESHKEEEAHYVNIERSNYYLENNINVKFFSEVEE